jgi:hypothetical protein
MIKTNEEHFDFLIMQVEEHERAVEEANKNLLYWRNAYEELKKRIETEEYVKVMSAVEEDCGL